MVKKPAMKKPAMKKPAAKKPAMKKQVAKKPAMKKVRRGMKREVPAAFAEYRAVLDKVRKENPNMPYRDAQKLASELYK